MLGRHGRGSMGRVSVSETGATMTGACGMNRFLRLNTCVYVGGEKGERRETSVFFEPITTGKTEDKSQEEKQNRKLSLATWGASVTGVEGPPRAAHSHNSLHFMTDTDGLYSAHYYHHYYHATIIAATTTVTATATLHSCRSPPFSPLYTPIPCPSFLPLSAACTGGLDTHKSPVYSYW